MSVVNKPLRAAWRKIAANQVAPADTDSTVFFVEAPVSESDSSIITNLNSVAPRVKYLRNEVANLTVVGNTTTGGGGGGGASSVNVMMERIRLRQTQVPDTLWIGITANGNWDYQIARTGSATNSQGEYQIVPDWSSIPWVDLPAGNNTSERVINTPSANANKWLQARIRNKAVLTEIYEIPAIGAMFYDWMVFAQPSAGVINTTDFQVLPYRTWSDDLIITKETGPTADTINVRFLSGFPRQAGTSWFWWISGVPLSNRANTDNFVVTLPKGHIFDVSRYVCPDPFRYYNQQGQVYATQPAFQMEGNYYENSADAITLLSLDEARFWTGR